MHRPYIAFTALTLAIASPARAQTHVLLGVDQLDRLPKSLQGKRVGLITNHTGRDRNGTSTIDLLAARTDIKLVALFGPEHGLRGMATGKVGDDKDEKTGLPVFSLFGETEKPTDAMLANVDALIFDIQDVGVRQYTYLSTMGMAMQAAAQKKIPFIVLDRPNPVTGTIVEGNIREPGMESFVGLYPIASRHGLTAGELAELYNKEFSIGADLHVVTLKGWKRTLWSDQTDLPWVKPSPNLPTFAGIINYPGTVFFEGTNLSEGRGSDNPFEQTGAPWLRAQEVADSMNARHLPGVQFSAVDFAVAAGARKFGGQTIHGVRLNVTDRDKYRPIATTLRLIDVIRKLHPNDFQWRWNAANPTAPRTYYFDTLTGSKRTRAAIENGTLETLLAEWDRDAQKFDAMRKPYLFY
ncbi:MAG: exo-beta-N-acetylmuramidase NamZ domain-containing protein [Gemmatimonadaceae bacterium]